MNINNVIHQDRERIIALQASNSKAFEYFYLAYKNKVYGFALKLFIDPEIAKEVVQQVFNKFWKKRLKLDPERSVEPYFYGIKVI